MSHSGIGGKEHGVTSTGGPSLFSDVSRKQDYNQTQGLELKKIQKQTTCLSSDRLVPRSYAEGGDKESLRFFFSLLWLCLSGSRSLLRFLEADVESRPALSLPRSAVNGQKLLTSGSPSDGSTN